MPRSSDSRCGETISAQVTDERRGSRGGRMNAGDCDTGEGEEVDDDLFGAGAASAREEGGSGWLS